MEGLTKILQTTLGGYSLSRILSALLTLLVCLVAARLLLKLAKRLLDRSKKLTARLRQIIIGRYAGGGGYSGQRGRRAGDPVVPPF